MFEWYHAPHSAQPAHSARGPGARARGLGTMSSRADNPLVEACAQTAADGASERCVVSQRNVLFLGSSKAPAVRRTGLCTSEPNSPNRCHGHRIMPRESRLHRHWHDAA